MGGSTSSSSPKQSDSSSFFSLDKLNIKKSAHASEGFSSKPKPKSNGKNGAAASACRIPDRCYGFLLLLLTVGSVIMQGPTLLASLNPHDSFRVVMPRLRRRGVMLPKEGEYAPVREGTVIPLVMLKRAPTEDYHVFCVAERSDETYMPHAKLTNLLMGLFDQPDQHLSILSWSVVGNMYLSRHRNEWVETNTTIVSQTVDTDLGQLQREFRPVFHRSFFFVVQTPGATESICKAPLEHTMMCIDPATELFFNNIEDQKLVIAKLTHRIQTEMPYFSKIDFSRNQIEALRRINYMQEMVMQMRDLPLSTAETKYGIKGGTAV